jgi:penicillin-binding protein 1C
VSIAWRRRIARVSAALGGLAALLLVLDRLFPPPLPPIALYSAELTDRGGSLLHALPGADRHWRFRCRLEDVSPRYLEALLALEDRRFFHHPGVDPMAVLRAAWQNLRAGRVVSGASTLTMQTARLIGSRSRGLTGKLRQSLRALQLEWHLDKREILQLYLALAPFGGNLSGVRAASLAYLGKEPLHLDHAEAALLAVLPRAPSRLRPDRYPDAARAARDALLRRMADSGLWSAEEVARALAAPVPTVRRSFPREAARFAERTARPGERIRSSLDRELQQRVERLLGRQLAQSAPGLAAAALLLDHRSGEVLVYASRLDPRSGEEDYLDFAARFRSPGSTLKPFLYALAIEDGLIHPESLLVDAPLSLDDYRPGNFDRRFRGTVSATAALAESLNTPAVDLMARTGSARLAARLARAGIPLRFAPGETPSPGMILGAVETRLFELTAAYGVFGNGGNLTWPRLRPDEEPVRSRPVFAAGPAWLTWHMLATDGEASFAFKTGTSHSFRDAWALGVNGRVTVGVWMGRPDGGAVRGLDGQRALGLLRELIATLPEPLRLPRPPRPADIVERETCWPLGTPAERTPAAFCHRKRRGLALAGRLPPTLPERRIPRLGARIETVLIDAASGLRVEAGCASGPMRRTQFALWPARALPWLDPELRTLATPPAWSPGCVIHRAGRLAIEGIPPGGRLLTASPAPAAIELRALGAEDQVLWFLNGAPVVQLAANATVRLTLARPGAHSVLALDGAGNHARVDFTYLGPAAPSAPR